METVEPRVIGWSLLLGVKQKKLGGVKKCFCRKKGVTYSLKVWS